MGRPAKPDEEKKIAGYPGKRKPDKNATPPIEQKLETSPTPVPVANVTAASTYPAPACLKTKSGVAVKKWEEFLPELADLGLLSTTDLETLTLLCLSVDRVYGLQAVVDDLGYTETITSNHGTRSMPRKEYQLLLSEQKNVLSFMEALGMTSASRTSILARGIKSNQLTLPFSPSGPLQSKEASPSPPPAAHNPNDPTGFVNRVH